MKIIYSIKVCGLYAAIQTAREEGDRFPSFRVTHNGKSVEACVCQGPGGEEDLTTVDPGLKDRFGDRSVLVATVYADDTIDLTSHFERLAKGHNALTDSRAIL